MRRRTAAAAMVLAALVAAGCGSSGSTAKSTNAQPPGSTAQGGPQTVGVQVDGKTPAYTASFTAYFPNEVKVRPGDSVKFKSTFVGEPHTVTLGTLVDAGLPKAQAAGPDAQDEPPELKKVPDLLPQGPGDAVQTTAQPCFLPSGDPPVGGAACSKEQQTQPDFDGTQSLFNSGFLPDQATFTLKLAKTIKPGTYNYFCALHRASMSGKITVVASGQSVPAPDQVTQDGQSQFNALVQKLQPTATSLKGGSLPPFLPQPKADQVLAGGGSMDVQNALVNEFGPATASVPVGGSLTWTIFGPHTISFSSPASAQSLLNKAPDGAVHLNMEAGAPSGGPGMPPPPSGPPPPPSNGPPPPPTPIDGGSWDGTGFHSSGIVLSFPGNLYTYKLAFKKAGSYSYVCLIHPDMKGTVKVG